MHDMTRDEFENLPINPEHPMWKKSQQSNESSATPKVHLEIGNGRIVYPNGHELCRMPASCVTGEWIDKANKIIDSFNAYDENQATIEKLKESLEGSRLTSSGLLDTTEKQGKVIKDLWEALDSVYGVLPGRVTDGALKRVDAALNSIPKEMLWK